MNGEEAFVTVLGIVTSVIAAESKALLPRSSKPSFSLTRARLVHSPKMKLSSFFTLEGISTSVSPVQPAKALEWSSVMCEGIVISFNPVQPEKALEGI